MHKVLPLLALSLIACSSTPRPPVKALEEQAPLGKLPADVRPTRYTLSLQIDPGKERFSGTSEIEVQLDRPRSVLWLHGADLHVTSASVEAGEKLDAAYAQADPAGVARLTLPRPVGPGKAVLRFAWDAPFNPHLRGVYLSHSDGRTYASTQFEEISARYAFPCFAEPRFKTPFSVTLTGPEAHLIVSNAAPQEETPLGDGLKRVRFRDTPPLPTYLILFAVGPWDELRAEAPPNEVRKRPIPMRFLAPKGRTSELAYAISAAGPLLERIERYFGSDLPFEKLDHIVVPDFEAGAMENAGAITYRERYLLFKEGVSRPDDKNHIAGGLAHEISHQWFGDAVTLPWWDEVWLNESFASWLEARITDDWDPSLDAGLDLFNLAERAMGTDSLRTARRIRQSIETPGDIQNAFDSLTYWKGGALLGMFERWLGPDTFRAGIRDYVSARRYGLGSTDELLQAVSRAAGKDVAPAFRSFIDQEGVPLVEARTVCEAGHARLDLSQSRYLPVGSEGSRERIWQVPVCARFATGGTVRESCTLLTEAHGTLPFEGGCPEWVMPNADGAGYYQWSLAAADLERLREVGYPKLRRRERISLARSLGAAVRGGTLPASAALSAVPVLARDEDGEVARQPVRLLEFAVHELVSESLRPQAARSSASLYAPVAARLGWRPAPGELQAARRLREAALTFLVRDAEDPKTLAEAARLGRAYAGPGDRFDPKVVPADLAGLALAAAVREGDASFWSALDSRLGKADDESTRRRILAALAATRDPALAERALSLALDPRLRANERLVPVGAMADNPAGRERAWAWIRAHLDELSKVLGERGMPGLLRIGGAFCDASHAASLRETFASSTAANPAMTRALANAVERVTLCAAVVHAQRPSADAFFKGLQALPGAAVSGK